MFLCGILRKTYKLNLCQLVRIGAQFTKKIGTYWINWKIRQSELGGGRPRPGRKVTRRGGFGGIGITRRGDSPHGSLLIGRVVVPGNYLNCRSSLERLPALGGGRRLAQGRKFASQSGSGGRYNLGLPGDPAGRPFGVGRKRGSHHFLTSSITSAASMALRHKLSGHWRFRQCSSRQTSSFL